MTSVLEPGTLLSRLLAVLLLLGVLFLIAAILILPFGGALRDTSIQIARDTEVLKRYASELTQLKTLEATDGAAPDKEEISYTFDGRSEAIAASKVQQAVRSAFQAVNAPLERLQFLPSQSFEGAEKLALRIETRLDLKALQEALYRLEKSAPSLFIEALEVRRKTRPNRNDEPSEDRDLVAKLTVFGLWDGP
ncbi:MAG: type II secretion system protein GspM [Pseudomonadota bacterium]